MKVLITGSSGMIGSGVLLECIDSPVISKIVILSRYPNKIRHPKIQELVVSDWMNLADIEAHLCSISACYYCLGASVTTLSESEYRRVTIDLTLSIVQTLLRLNPEISICFVSGQGVDGTTTSKTMWVSVKGEAEQALLRLGIKSVYMVRPGYIQPMRGVKSKTPLYRLFYGLMSPFYPILKRLMPRYVTSSVQIGRAMIAVSVTGYSSSFLENRDINRLSEIPVAELERF